MVKGAGYVGDAIFPEHHQHRLHDATDGADRTPIRRSYRRQGEMGTEKLVGAVYQVDFHGVVQVPPSDDGGSGYEAWIGSVIWVGYPVNASLR